MPARVYAFIYIFCIVTHNRRSQLFRVYGIFVKGRLSCNLVTVVKDVVLFICFCFCSAFIVCSETRKKYALIVRWWLRWWWRWRRWWCWWRCYIVAVSVYQKWLLIFWFFSFFFSVVRLSCRMPIGGWYS